MCVYVRVCMHVCFQSFVFNCQNAIADKGPILEIVPNI